MKKETGHQKDLFKIMLEDENFKRETAILTSLLGGSNINIWLTENGMELALLDKRKPSCSLIKSKKNSLKSCRKKIISLSLKTRRKKKPVCFECGKKKHGIAIPVVQGDRVYGHLIVCNAENDISEELLDLFINFISILIREVQKRLELSKVYNSIRPRAIALSTIHTIHRIISSTLNIDELLPKLARLSLQIFRADQCCIAIKNNGRSRPVVMEVAKNGVVNKHGKGKKWCAATLKRERVISKGRIVSTKKTLCVPLTDEDVIGAICVKGKSAGLHFDNFDKEILLTLSEQAAVAIKNAQLYKEQEDITIGSIKSLAAIMDARKGLNYKTRESFAKIAIAIGKELGLRMDRIRNLHYAVILHDAGQMSFSDDLLMKSEKLTGHEYRIIRRHPARSAAIIKHIPFLKPVVPIILYHHENYDGTGYPKGLKGEQIPLDARIMSLVSAFGAMITTRPYRKKVAIDTAILEIKKNSGVQFDPMAVKAFLKVVKEPAMQEILKKGI